MSACSEREFTSYIKQGALASTLTRIFLLQCGYIGLHRFLLVSQDSFIDLIAAKLIKPLLVRPIIELSMSSQVFQNKSAQSCLAGRKAPLSVS